MFGDPVDNDKEAKVTPLREHLDLIGGFAFKSSGFVKEGIPVLRIGNINAGYFKPDDLPFWEYDESLKRYMLYPGDLVISLTGTVGKDDYGNVCRLGNDYQRYYLNQRNAKIQLRDTVLPEYVTFLLKNRKVKEKIANAGVGVRQANISNQAILNLEVPVPKLAEQKVFATIVQQSDKSKFPLYRGPKSQFIARFGDPVENPMRWQTRPLLTLGSCKNGMNFLSTDSGVEISCLGVGDFKDYDIIAGTHDLPTVSLNAMPPDDYLLKDGDIVFVRSNGNKTMVGRSVVVYPGDNPTTFSGFCIRYRNADDTIKVPFLLRVLKTESMRKQMYGRGANIQNLNQKTLATLSIPVPPMEAQKEYVAFVEQSDKSK